MPAGPVTPTAGNQNHEGERCVLVFLAPPFDGRGVQFLKNWYCGSPWHPGVPEAVVDVPPGTVAPFLIKELVFTLCATDWVLCAWIVVAFAVCHALGEWLPSGGDLRGGA